MEEPHLNEEHVVPGEDRPSGPPLLQRGTDRALYSFCSLLHTETSRGRTNFPTTHKRDPGEVPQSPGTTILSQDLALPTPGSVHLLPWKARGGPVLSYHPENPGGLGEPYTGIWGCFHLVFAAVRRLHCRLAG